MNGRHFTLDELIAIVRSDVSANLRQKAVETAYALGAHEAAAESAEVADFARDVGNLVTGLRRDMGVAA